MKETLLKLFTHQTLAQFSATPSGEPTNMKLYSFVVAICIALQYVNATSVLVKSDEKEKTVKLSDTQSEQLEEAINAIRTARSYNENSKEPVKMLWVPIPKNKRPKGPPLIPIPITEQMSNSKSPFKIVVVEAERGKYPHQSARSHDEILKMVEDLESSHQQKGENNFHEHTVQLEPIIPIDSSAGNYGSRGSGYSNQGSSYNGGGGGHEETANKVESYGGPQYESQPQGQGKPSKQKESSFRVVSQQASYSGKEVELNEPIRVSSSGGYNVQSGQSEYGQAQSNYRGNEQKFSSGSQVEVSSYGGREQSQRNTYGTGGSSYGQKEDGRYGGQESGFSDEMKQKGRRGGEKPRLQSYGKTEVHVTVFENQHGGPHGQHEMGGATGGSYGRHQEASSSQNQGGYGGYQESSSPSSYGGYQEESSSGGYGGHQETSSSGGYGGHQETSSSGGYGGHQETSASGGYGGHQETSSSGGYGGHQETSASGGYGGHQETSASGGYGGHQETSSSGSYGGHQETSSSGGYGGHQETSASGGYGGHQEASGGYEGPREVPSSTIQSTYGQQQQESGSYGGQSSYSGHHNAVQSGNYKVQKGEQDEHEPVQISTNNYGTSGYQHIETSSQGNYVGPSTIGSFHEVEASSPSSYSGPISTSSYQDESSSTGSYGSGHESGGYHENIQVQRPSVYEGPSEIHEEHHQVGGYSGPGDDNGPQGPYGGESHGESGFVINQHVVGTGYSEGPIIESEPEPYREPETSSYSPLQSFSHQEHTQQIHQDGGYQQENVHHQGEVHRESYRPPPMGVAEPIIIPLPLPLPVPQPRPRPVYGAEEEAEEELYKPPCPHGIKGHHSPHFSEPFMASTQVPRYVSSAFSKYQGGVQVSPPSLEPYSAASNANQVSISTSGQYSKSDNSKGSSSKKPFYIVIFQKQKVQPTATAY